MHFQELAYQRKTSLASSQSLCGLFALVSQDLPNAYQASFCLGMKFHKSFISSPFIGFLASRLRSASEA
jgi:hypothetical protein